MLANNTASNWGLVNGSEAARLAVNGAIDALGGRASPGGSCAWHVLGCEMPLTRWVIGYSGRRISRLAASGILLTDLGILSAYFHT